MKIKSIPDWHLFISRMETKWTKWYAMTSHVIAYRSLELLFGTHTFHFNCFFEDFNCVFTQIRYLSRVLGLLAFYVAVPFKNLQDLEKLTVSCSVVPRARHCGIPAIFPPMSLKNASSEGLRAHLENLLIIFRCFLLFPYLV